MSVRNASGPRVAMNPRQRQLLILALVVFAVILLASRLFGAHENRYEKLAREVTVALQKNDVDAVRKYQNAETATTVTRGVVGRAADRLVPLGSLKSVKESAPADGGDRVHEFLVTFDKGAIRESMKLDPDGKIVHFRYEKVTQ